MATSALRQPLLERMSWGALLAGFFFGCGIWMLLLSLGAGIGFSAFDPRDLGSWQGLGIGFGIWGVLSAMVAAFLGGWLAARTSRSGTVLAGMLHGAALWGFMVVAGIWIATTAAAGAVAKAANVAGGAVQGSGLAAGQAARSPSLRRQAEAEAGAAQQRVEASAPEPAETAKKAGATGAWAFFVSGLLTLAAAILGGRTGVPREGRAVRQERRAPPPGEPLPHRV
jgi:hypothetical protein